MMIFRPVPSSSARMSTLYLPTPASLSSKDAVLVGEDVESTGAAIREKSESPSVVPVSAHSFFLRRKPERRGKKRDANGK